MPTYAIGDLQGCHGKLAELLESIYKVSPNPRLIFVGDIVNRGPESLATLRQVKALPNAEIVLGNHDLHLLAVSCGLHRVSRSDTLDDILAAPDRDELLEWLRQRPLALMEQGCLVVHAGLVPQWTAEQALRLADEVHEVLRGPRWVEFLGQMYGNLPDQWDNGLQGVDRLRCIVNALTRIRFCTADGRMELGGTKGVEPDLPGLLRWFDVPGRRTEGVPVVFGHWSTLGLINRSDLVSLDTGCLWGGKLTAVCLDDRSVIQVDCPQYCEPGSI
ncbi:symmetrical bis(5'-nucleosyl)-tetraphosphatase [Noviherbaspirillum galbum]|uniref:bis(5'-nucleosyl)-tetraphosphatase (symmetrical) n=1 Tax=Noviherbaspirillum galbum TaxID=2709383 RepID=A0A6B3SZ92_9BURK|nr:symmetrical bis(5'-nucleosyl)-tetraphosphatase [Noviherbaspirillum galbum]NEX64472.1 symmetrical bis(5'-nucleosyl)-tetraphosphatase [Noviherbaspirillum galbum]